MNPSVYYNPYSDQLIVIYDIPGQIASLCVYDSHLDGHRQKIRDMWIPNGQLENLIFIGDYNG